MEREVVLTKRDTEALLIPSGTPITIPKDTFVTITQALGGHFTVAVNGNLARIDAKNADALGKEPPKMDYDDVVEGEVNINHVWDALRSVYDPEIPVNVVDLGLIYGVDIRKENGKNHVYIRMTLTAPGCGMGPSIAEDVKRRVEAVPNVDGVDVELVFDPPWSSDRMSDEAKLELGMF